MPVGAVETEHVHDGFTLRRINDLANAQQRFAPRYGEKVSDARIGSGSVDFFVGVTQFDFVIALENAEQRFACDGSVKQAGKLGGAEIADFERERLAGRVAKPFELDDAAIRPKRKARRGFVFIIHDLGEEHFGAGTKGARGHLLGVAHELVEMNLWRSDERADAAAAFDKAFAFEGSEGVARGHEADVMRLGELDRKSTRLNSSHGYISYAVFRLDK